MIKLFATDIDGTLLAKRHEFDERVISCVNQIVEHGYYFSVATGRNVQRSTVKEFLGKAYTICMNGSVILDPDQNVLYAIPINKESIIQLIHSFPDIHFQFVTKETTLCMFSLEEHLEMASDPSFVLKYLASNFLYDQSKDTILNQDIYKINAYMEPGKSYTDLYAFLDAHSDDLVNAPCSNELIEITKAGVNKGTAIQFLTKHLGICEDEVAVYGDGGNDVAMLDMFEHSYSPSDASPEAKKVSKNILDPHDEYSVTNHMLETIKEAGHIYE